MPPIAYLAMRAVAALPRSSRSIVAAGIGALAVAISVMSTRQYASMEAPAFRVLREMRGAAGHSDPPVLAMHRREDLDLRRPMQWVGAEMPAFARRLNAPPKHEWLELVKCWNQDGRAPVWFVADPLRTDLALIDRSVDRSRDYRWGLDYPVLISGVRPNEMDWHVFDSPGWYLGQGWALTPETAGVAAEDRRGPAHAPIDGWIRRRRDAVMLMLGGRNLETAAESARVQVTIDDRPVAQLSVPPGFFLRFLPLPESALAGAGRYAHLSIAAGQSRVALEQFDAQSSPRGVFGFGEGWHEMEYNPATGRSWRWISEQGVIRTRALHGALTLRIAGETEGFFRTTNVSVRVGTRAIGRWAVGSQFAVETVIPADAPANDETAMVIESDQFFIPAERSRRSQDRRHLALRVNDVSLTPVSSPGTSANCRTGC